MEKKTIEPLILRVIEADPKSVRMLDKNPHFMKNETFKQLKTNVETDKALSSVPLAIRDPDGVYRILSGNHRIKAAIQAGIEKVFLIVTDQDLPIARQRAIAVSHNALNGEDDPVLLKEYYESIYDMDWKVYAGLDDKQLELLQKVSLDSLSEAQVKFIPVMLLFLPDEMEKIAPALKEALSTVKGDEQWLVAIRQYDHWLEAIDTVSSSYDIKNLATCFEIILKVFDKHKGDLTEGYMTEDGELKHSKVVPLATIFGTDKVSPKMARSLMMAVKKAQKIMVEGKVQTGIQILEGWAEGQLRSEDGQ